MDTSTAGFGALSIVPREIRDEIYQYALTDDVVYICPTWVSKKKTTPTWASRSLLHPKTKTFASFKPSLRTTIVNIAILRASKSIYNEARHYVCSHANFTYFFDYPTHFIPPPFSRLTASVLPQHVTNLTIWVTVRKNSTRAWRLDGAGQKFAQQEPWLDFFGPLLGTDVQRKTCTIKLEVEQDGGPANFDRLILSSPLGIFLKEFVGFRDLYLVLAHELPYNLYKGSFSTVGLGEEYRHRALEREPIVRANDEAVHKLVRTFRSSLGLGHYMEADPNAWRRDPAMSEPFLYETALHAAPLLHQQHPETVKWNRKDAEVHGKKMWDRLGRGAQ
ncbi:uncharacterized protein KY384_008624, partial [Bacidia gigantensis]|uniref:uncharacterized protein n=1 Tax=Bacidia gigantensis TaxID=2732470 RepID=UPI001D03D7F2